MLWYDTFLIYSKKGQRWTDEFNYLLYNMILTSMSHQPEMPKKKSSIKIRNWKVWVGVQIKLF